MAGGGGGGKILLGNVRLNLAEYVNYEGQSYREEDGQGVARRYLMQDSKINSTLKVRTKVPFSVTLFGNFLHFFADHGFLLTR